MDLVVQEGAINRVAGQITDASDQFRDDIRKFINAVDVVQASWQGDDSTRYVTAVRDDLVPTLEEIADILQNYGEYLKTVPSAYSTLDESFSSKNLG